MSTRDWINVLFLAGLAVLALAWPKSRTSALGVLRALFSAPIMITLSAIAAYLALCVYGLHKLGLWQPRDWLLTLNWLVGSAFLSVLRTKEIAEKPTSWRALLRDIVGVAVVLQFIAGAYSLAWWLELLLVPVIVFFAIIAAMAEREARTRSVAVLAYLVLASIVTLFLYNGIANAVAHWSEFATIETVRLFLLPIALSTAMAPALIFLAHYMTFERLYNGSRIYANDANVRRYAMTRALLTFGFDHVRVARFYAKPFPPDTFADRAHIDDRIAELKTRMAREAKPPPVDPNEGWSPYLASRFLAPQGLEALDYRPGFDCWSANSKPLQLGSKPYQAFVEYFVEGDENTARRLRLNGYVEKTENLDDYRPKFYAIAAALATAALDAQAASLVAERLASGAEFELSVAGRLVSLTLDDSAIAGGGAHEVTFQVDYRQGYQPYAVAIIAEGA